MGDDSCQSCAAQRSVVGNGVGDRWHILHARVNHGITLICICHNVALGRQIKRSSLYVYAPVLTQACLSFLILHSPSLSRSNILTYARSYTVQTQTFLKLSFPSHLILLSFSYYLSLPSSFFCALISVMQAKSS